IGYECRRSGQIQPVGAVGPLGGRAESLTSTAGDVHSCDPVGPAAVQPDPVAIPPHRPALDPDRVDAVARYSNPDVPVGHRVAALEHPPVEVDAGSGRGSDNDASIGRVGDPISPGAD